MSRLSWIAAAGALALAAMTGSAHAAAPTIEKTACVGDYKASGLKVDHRCDLFSLGCVLYRLCTGEMPFKGTDTIAILSALALEAPPPPCELHDDVPQPLSDLVMQLLAKKPKAPNSKSKMSAARSLP